MASALHCRDHGDAAMHAAHGVESQLVRKRWQCAAMVSCASGASQLVGPVA